MSSQNKRKSKVPQKRESTTDLRFQLNNNYNSILSNDNTNNSMLDLKMRLNQDISNNVCININNIDSNQFNNCKNVSEIINRLVPEPNFDIHDCQEIKSIYNEIQQQCLAVDDLIGKYMKCYANLLFEHLNNPIPISSNNNNNIISNNNNNNNNNENQSPLSTGSINSCVTMSQSSNDNAQPTDLSLQSMNQTNIVDLSHTKKTLIKTEIEIQNPDLLLSSPKRKTFRGTSDEENKIDLNYHPTIVNDEVILSSHIAPDIRIPKEIFQMMLLKSANSATRLIRLLMKHFFNQKILAISSLSGEGYYKNKLNPKIISTIKDFIRHRHPKLKNGSINLCMTDVCVQARRVYRSKVPM